MCRLIGPLAFTRSGSAHVPAPAEAPLRSNAAAFQLAPVPVLPPVSVQRFAGPPAVVEVTLDFTPNIWPGQNVELLLGAEAAVAPPRVVATSSASFTFADMSAGDYPVRLRVDGVESWLVIREIAPVGPDFAPEPPQFDPSQTITVPA